MPGSSVILEQFTTTAKTSDKSQEHRPPWNRKAADAVGVFATYSYDGSSRLVKVTYADGSSVIFTYGANSMITSVTDGLGKILEAHTYDSQNRGLTSSRALGADLVTVDYSVPGATQLNDSLGNATTYNTQYTGGRMFVNSVSGSGCASCGGRGNSNLNYDSFGDVSSSTDANGNLTCYTYDGAGDILTKTLAPPGGSCPGGGGVFGFAATSAAASSPSKQLQMTASTTPASSGTPSCTENNGVKFCAFSPTQPAKAAAPVKSALSVRPLLGTGGGGGSQDAVTWTYTYNDFSEVTTAMDPAGNTTYNNYDNNGNLLSTTTPSPDGVLPGSTTSFAYDSKGELLQITDPNGNVTNMTYTPAGLVSSITDAQGNATSFTYDLRGNRLSSTDALGETTLYTYDAMNRLIKTTAPDGSTTSFGYDYRGRRTSATDANGKTTQYAYDDADRLVSTTDAAGHVTSYAYNTENELTAITDAASHTTTFAYDPQGHVTQVTFPSTLTENYTYDAVENLLTKTDRNGHVISYSYDFLNRLSTKQYPDGTAVNYTYDPLSRLTQVSDPTGNYAFTYDNMGRLTGTSTQYAFLNGQTLTNAYAYDADSNRVSFTNAQGGVTTYNYDTLNRLASLTDFASRQFGFGYDVLGRRTSLTRPNGVNTSYSYDQLSRLLSVIHQGSAGTIDGASYVYDAAGNRTSKTTLPSNVISAFSYDPIYQVTQVMQGATRAESYQYDAVGNRTYQPGAPYTYNSSNEMLTREGAQYTYDNNGNLLTKRNGIGTTTYAWDFENRLTSVTVPSTGVVNFAYDPFGRRIEKISSAGVATIYVYDGSNIEEELNADGSLGERYTYGPNIDEPLVGQRQPKIFYYEADGSARSLR